MATIPKCKEDAYRKHKEREEVWAFDYQFFYQHALYVGYNVTNALYNRMKKGKGVLGLAPRNIFANAFHTTLENVFLQVS